MPRITPLEIQKQRFSRKWRGLDPVEVESFLAMAAEELEDLARAKSELESRVRALDEENVGHRERERMLRDTLTTAQRASEDIRDAALREAELTVREAQDASERLTHHALQRSAEIEKAIHDLKLQRASFRLELQKMLELYATVLEEDRREDEKDRPLSYLTPKKDKGETG